MNCVIRRMIYCRSIIFLFTTLLSFNQKKNVNHAYNYQSKKFCCIYCTLPSVTVDNANFPKLFPMRLRDNTDIGCRNTKNTVPDQFKGFSPQFEQRQERQSSFGHTICVLFRNKIRETSCSRQAASLFVNLLHGNIAQ